MELLERLVDNFALPVLATLVAGLVGALPRWGWRRRHRRPTPSSPLSDPCSTACAEFDAAVALSAACLSRLAEERRSFTFAQLRRVRGLAGEAERQAGEVARSYSALRTGADPVLLDAADALLTALGELGQVLQKPRRLPMSSSLAWHRAWDQFLDVQLAFRDTARQQLGAPPYRRTASR